MKRRAIQSSERRDPISSHNDILPFFVDGKIGLCFICWLHVLACQITGRWHIHTSRARCELNVQIFNDAEANECRVTHYITSTHLAIATIETDKTFSAIAPSETIRVLRWCAYAISIPNAVQKQKTHNSPPSYTHLNKHAAVAGKYVYVCCMIWRLITVHALHSNLIKWIPKMQKYHRDIKMPKPKNLQTFLCIETSTYRNSQQLCLRQKACDTISS